MAETFDPDHPLSLGMTLGFRFDDPTVASASTITSFVNPLDVYPLVGHRTYEVGPTGGAMRTYRTDNAQAGIYAAPTTGITVRPEVYGTGDAGTIFWRGYKTETMSGNPCTMAGFHAGSFTPFKLTAQASPPHDDRYIRVNYEGSPTQWPFITAERWNTALNLFASVAYPGQVRLYDGATRVINTENTIGMLPFSPDTYFLVGPSKNGAFCWGGGVSLVMYWDRVLTQEEISEINADPYVMWTGDPDPPVDPDPPTTIQGLVLASASAALLASTGTPLGHRNI